MSANRGGSDQEGPTGPRAQRRLVQPAALGPRLPARQTATGILLLLILTSGCVGPGPRKVQVRRVSGVESRIVDSSREGGLRLLTFNVWGLPVWMTGTSPERYVRIANQIEDREPDVVFLQEVWTTAAGRAIPAGGGWFAAASEPASCFFRRNGLVTLSRFPIVGGEFHAFRSRALPDSLVKKGALKITVELSEGRRVNLWNVHLQSGSASRTRSRQIDELAAWVGGAEDGQAADIIAGDFNCTPDSEDYRQLCSLFGPDTQRKLKRPHLPTYDGLSPNPADAQTLDYVFAVPRRAPIWSEGEAAIVFTANLPEDRLSDHLAVEVSIRLGPLPAVRSQATAGDLVSVLQYPARRLLAPAPD